MKLGPKRELRAAVTFGAFVWLTSCAPDFDQLSNGGAGAISAGGGGSSAIAGAGMTAGAGTAANGGVDSQAGLANGGDAGDFSLAGESGSASDAAGAAGDAGDASSAGKNSSAGTASAGASHGGSAGSAGSAGTGGAHGLDSVCPSYTGTGTLLLPPSTGFEAAGSWETRGHHVCTQTTATLGTGNACEGNSFLNCDGIVRIADWDGPAIDATANIIYGHTYAVTVALRYSPESAPTTPSPLTFTYVRACQGGNEQYTDLSAPVNATYNWVRISGQFTASLPGCTQLSELSFYAGTFVAQQTYKSLDMDDFRIYDLTPGASGSSGTGGTNGGSGTGGASGSGAGG